MEESVKESSAEENAEISVQETELQIISEKSTSCSICGKFFDTNRRMTQHMNRFIMKLLYNVINAKNFVR